MGSSGQISLGKEYAGCTVVVDNPEEGVWVIRTAQVIPDNEMWLREEPAKSKVATGLAWASKTPTKITNLEDFEKDVRKRWEAEHGERLD